MMVLKGGDCEIKQYWSDGGVQRIKARISNDRLQSLNANELWCKGRRHYGPFLQVEWSDGSASYYLDDSYYLEDGGP